MMTQALPVRKPNRLKGYDYASCGLYFITICTKDRECLLWDNVGAIPCAHRRCDRPPVPVPLSTAGKIVEAELAVLSTVYEHVRLELCCIMPNHVHLLLQIHPAGGGRSQIAPTVSVSRAVKQFKGAVSKRLGESIWQKSFYDHIVRDEKEYIKIAEYIENNPANWVLDQLYRDANSRRGDL